MNWARSLRATLRRVRSFVQPPSAEEVARFWELHAEHGRLQLLCEVRLQQINELTAESQHLLDRIHTLSANNTASAPVGQAARLSGFTSDRRAACPTKDGPSRL